MGLTTALFTSLSGLTSNSEAISVTGNNIANLNTTGFKASRVTFETQILQTLEQASAPSADLGGSNPSQVGLGTSIGAITRNFNTGSLAPTGVATDLAIEGNGFFVLNVEGAQRFTRAGNFQLDRDFNLVNADGGLVQGFGVDDEFNVAEGVLTNVNIPVGVLTLAEATKGVTLTGNLNTNGDVAFKGSRITSDSLYVAGGKPAVTTDALTSLFDSTGSPRFMAGDLITVTGVQKGNATIAEQSFEVGRTNTLNADSNGETLGEFVAFIEDILGIDTNVSGGVTINGAGRIVINGNTGAVNDIALASENILLNQTTNSSLPFVFHKDAQTGFADGESVRTTFVAYDSLGSPLRIDVAMVLEDKTNTGTTWRYYAQSDNDTDLDRVLGSGVLEFDTNGAIISTSQDTFTIDHDNTGAFSPQQIKLTFDAPVGSLSALADRTSQLAALDKDGSPIGTLQSFSVSDDGTIVGVFSNSLLRDLGRIVLGQFVNPVGLLEEGANLFSASANSGIPTILQPGQGGSGRIIGGALELSNAELSNEFISLINASTGFSASSRVLTTSDRLMQELLATLR